MTDTNTKDRRTFDIVRILIVLMPLVGTNITGWVSVNNNIDLLKYEIQYFKKSLDEHAQQLQDHEYWLKDKYSHIPQVPQLPTECR